MKFVAIDLETTALDPSYGSIIQVGAVRYDNGKVDTFSTLVFTTSKIPEKVIELTGIKNSMLQGKPNVMQVLTDLHEFVGDFDMIAQNAKFDKKFLQAKSQKYLGKEFSNEFKCTLEMTRKYMKERGTPLDNYRLNTLARHFGIPIEKHHDALSDARTCGDIYLALHGIEPCLTPKTPFVKNIVNSIVFLN